MHAEWEFLAPAKINIFPPGTGQFKISFESLRVRSIFYVALFLTVCCWCADSMTRWPFSSEPLSILKAFRIDHLSGVCPRNNTRKYFLNIGRVESRPMIKFITVWWLKVPALPQRKSSTACSNKSIALKDIWKWKYSHDNWFCYRLLTDTLSSHPAAKTVTQVTNFPGSWTPCLTSTTIQTPKSGTS